MSGHVHDGQGPDVDPATGDEAETEEPAMQLRQINRILWNEVGGCIDEIVGLNATVHIEQMNDNCWWIGITLQDGTWWAGNFHTKRAPMQFTEQESDVAWDHEGTHELTGTGHR